MIERQEAVVRPGAAVAERQQVAAIVVRKPDIRLGLDRREPRFRDRRAGAIAVVTCTEARGSSRLPSNTRASRIRNSAASTGLAGLLVSATFGIDAYNIKPSARLLTATATWRNFMPASV